MPLPTGPCGVSAQVCCDTLFATATRIMEVAHQAVIDCHTDCAGDPIVGYVSMGTRIEDPVADRVTVSLSSVFPAPEAQRGRGGHQFLPIFRARFQVLLLESGWPTPWGDSAEIDPPPAQDYMAAALHGYAHGEAMYRALVNAMYAGELHDGDCYKQIEPLLPVEPSGGAVGWQTALIFDSGWSGPG